MPNPTADFPTTLHDPTDLSAFSGSQTLGGSTPTQTQVMGKIEQEVLEIQEKLGIGASNAEDALSGDILRADGAGGSEWQRGDEFTGDYTFYGGRVDIQDDTATPLHGIGMVMGGSTVNMEAHTDAWYFRVWDGPGFGVGTERPKMLLKPNEDTSQLLMDWEISGSLLGAAHHWFGSTPGANEARLNDDNQDADTIIRGMLDDNLLFADASADFIGI